MSARFRSDDEMRDTRDRAHADDPSCLHHRNQTEGRVSAKAQEDKTVDVRGELLSPCADPSCLHKGRTEPDHRANDLRNGRMQWRDESETRDETRDRGAKYKKGRKCMQRKR